jgi:hypothetical protein
MPQLKLYDEAEVTPPPRRRLSSLRRNPTRAIHQEPLGPFHVIEHGSEVVSAELDLTTNSIQVRYVSHRREAPREVSATFADSPTADAVFTALRERLGDDWHIQPVQDFAMSRARLPLGVLLGILLATAIMALLAVMAEDAGPAGGGLAARWDWRWICGLGGTAAAVAQVWLYRSLTAPPTTLELSRG